MSTEPDPIELLDRTLDRTGAVIAAVRPAQASLPTPCRSWNVAQLIHHLIDDLDKFTTAARNEMPNWGNAPAEVMPEAWAHTFKERAETLMQTWRAAERDAPSATPAGSQPLIRRADQQIAELATHTWDLTRATEQPADIDDEISAHALVWARENLKPEFRGDESSGKVFGFEVPVSGDAAAIDQLAAWFGRDPTWRPGGCSI